MSLVSELHRRNVIRVAVGYVVTAWLVIQVVETIVPAFGSGDEAIRLVVISFATGFVPVLILSWIFEWTPQGLRKDDQVDRSRTAQPTAHRTFDRVVMGILALAVGLFAFDKFVLEPARDAKMVEAARIAGRTDAVIESYGVKSIAIVPFVNLSSDPEQAHFADGVAEDVLNLFAQIPELRVISRSSSFAYRGEDLKISEIADRLQVAHILEGSVRKSGNRVRVTAQLIEAGSDSHLWSETFDRDLSDIFAIQDEIAEKIVENLQIELIGPVPTARRTDPVALALVIEARQVFYDAQSVPDSTDAGDHMGALLDRALEIDPDYTPALAWYAYANWMKLEAGLISADEEQRLFDELAARALAIDPEQAMILQSMAWDELFKNNNVELAASLYQRALRSAPHDSEVLRQVGRFAYLIGRFEDSNALYERAVELDPLCDMCLYFLSFSYLVAGRFDAAEEARSRFILVSGGGGYYYYGIIKLMQGDARTAMAIFEKPGSSIESHSHMGRTLALYSLGRRDESDRELENLTERWADSEPILIAQAHAWRDEKDAAFQWLGRAIAVPDDPQFGRQGILQALVNPLFHKLHDDPRWEEHRRRAGLSTARAAAIEIDLRLNQQPALRASDPPRVPSV